MGAWISLNQVAVHPDIQFGRINRINRLGW